MKTLRRISAAIILSLTVVVSASAGDIHAPGVVTTGTSTPPAITSVLLTIVNVIHS